MNNYEKLEFNSSTFPARKLNLPNFGLVLISTTSLSHQLINSDGGYTSDSAQFIDDKIFYFVDNHQIDLSNGKLKKLILSEVL